MPKHILSLQDIDTFTYESLIASTSGNKTKKLLIKSVILNGSIESKFVVYQGEDLKLLTSKISEAIEAYNDLP